MGSVLAFQVANSGYITPCGNIKLFTERVGHLLEASMIDIILTILLTNVYFPEFAT